MPAPDLFELPVLLQALEGELADCLQHPEPVLALADEALLDEGSDRVQVRIADLLGCLEREAADEHGESREEPLLGLVEQLVTPRDRVPEGALAVRHVPTAAGQHGEPPVEPLEQGRRREHLCPGRGQLDRKGKTVQTPADLGNGRRIAVQVEIRLDRLRPFG